MFGFIFASLSFDYFWEWVNNSRLHHLSSFPLLTQKKIDISVKNTKIMYMICFALVPQNDSVGVEGPPAELRQCSVYVHTPLFFICVCEGNCRQLGQSGAGRLAHLCFWFWLSIYLSLLTCCTKLTVVYQLTAPASRCANCRQMCKCVSFFSTSVSCNLCEQTSPTKKGVVLVLTCQWPSLTSSLTTLPWQARWLVRVCLQTQSHEADHTAQALV